MNSRRENLKTKPIQVFLDGAERNYLQATLPRKIASVTMRNIDERHDFDRVSVWSQVSLKRFNDDHTLWEMYVADSARALAARERNYLLDALIEQLESTTTSISLSDPDFEPLESAVATIVDREYHPNALIAPVQIMVEFTKHFGEQMDWQADPETLQIGGAKLRVFWSSRMAPLQSFIVVTPNAGTWHVVPDIDTGSAITVALGQSRLYPDQVEFGLETLAKYEIREPECFAMIPLVE